MPSMTFFPLGNADSCLISLDSQRKILVDYADKRCADDPTDKRIDLPTELRKDLGKRDYYDVVVFTHVDDDHIKGSSDFFFLQHAAKYQTPGRIKINQMWVPAATITEDKLDEEDRIIQAEARYRLENKKDIRVFSRPDRLKNWLEKKGIKLDDVRHLIVDAGNPVDTFTLAQDGVEFFVHAPFAKHMNEREVEDRNIDSIVMQVTFEVAGVKTKAILAADTRYENWADIVDITRGKGREERLEWDIMKLAHHCSAFSLAEDRNTPASPNKTLPVDQVKYLCEKKGLDHCRIISTSRPIPAKGSEADQGSQPPHREAANYYKENVLKSSALNDRWLVTMEHPSEASPKPIVIKINERKATLEKAFVGGVAAVASRPAPRVGKRA